MARSSDRPVTSFDLVASAALLPPPLRPDGSERRPRARAARRRSLWWLVALLAAGAIAAVLADVSTRPVAPISAAALTSARAFKQYTVYWAGLEVGGVRLTAADTPNDFSSPVGFTMYYGDCGARGLLRSGGCTLPLTITTTIYDAHLDAPLGTRRWLSLHGVPAVAYDRGKDIQLYTDRMVVDIAADTAARAMEAVVALAPFNRVPTATFPAFPQPRFTPVPAAPATRVASASG